MSKSTEVSINIQVVKGGFILEYPETTKKGDDEFLYYHREVFSSQGKLQRKVKEVLESFKLTAEE